MGSCWGMTWSWLLPMDRKWDKYKKLHFVLLGVHNSTLNVTKRRVLALGSAPSASFHIPFFWTMTPLQNRALELHGGYYLLPKELNLGDLLSSITLTQRSSLLHCYRIQLLPRPWLSILIMYWWILAVIGPLHRFYTSFLCWFYNMKLKKTHYTCHFSLS